MFGRAGPLLIYIYISQTKPRPAEGQARPAGTAWLGSVRFATAPSRPSLLGLAGPRLAWLGGGGDARDTGPGRATALVPPDGEPTPRGASRGDRSGGPRGGQPGGGAGQGRGTVARGAAGCPRTHDDGGGLAVRRRQRSAEGHADWIGRCGGLMRGAMQAGPCCRTCRSVDGQGCRRQAGRAGEPAQRASRKGT